MPDVVTPDRPLLTVIPGVELLEVGINWPLMSDGTEDGTFTPDDLAAAVAAAAGDPSVRAPVVKFGHTAALDPLGDGAPVWGRATNLRLANEGMTLVCDLAGVPSWLADVMASAWPSRSIEGRRNVTSETGKAHGLVIDAVALLGVELPAISTLAEVRAVWAARTAESANVTVKETTMPTTAGRRPALVAAAVDHEDILRAYYESLPSGDWSWVRRLQLAPTMVLLVDDDNGKLWRIPATITDDAVSFGTPVQVEEPAVEDYVAVTDATTSASRSVAPVIVFASRNESREGVAGMDPVALRTSLGLADTATDEEVMARATELAARPDPTTTPPPIAEVTTPPTGDAPPPATGTQAAPAGTVVVDADQWETVQRQAAEGALAASRMRTQERDRFLAAVRGEGRLAASNTRLRETLEREWDRDPVAARSLADTFARVVPTAEIGHDAGGDEGTGDPVWDAFERDLSPDVAATRAARQARP